jgi:chromosome segregation ATPase
VEHRNAEQVEALKKTHKYLKEIQENTIIQMKGLNKHVHNLKMEIETTKKSQREATPKMENLEKRACTTKRIQKIEERISGIKHAIKDIDIAVKENTKYKKLLIQNIQKFQNKMKRPNLRIIGVEETEDSQFKRLENKFNIIE